MRAFRGVTLGTVLGVFLWLLLFSVAQAVGPTTWTETWANQSEWQGSGCVTPGNSLLVCNPGGAIKTTTRQWSAASDIHVSWSMSGKSAVGSSNKDYFVSLTLWQRESSPTLSNYLSLALVNHVPPFDKNHHNRIGVIASPQPGYRWNVRPIVIWDPGTVPSGIMPGTSYPFTLDWKPGQNKWFVGWKTHTQWGEPNPFIPGLPVKLLLIVGCLGELEAPNGCKTDGKFGPITITGTPV